MSFDPNREDYQRLGLRFARSLDGKGLGAAREFAGFGRRFAQDRDSLPQTDADRAFHLVALATRAIDYELPFATDEQASRLIDSAKGNLDEAVALDDSCHDAYRMLAAGTEGTFEAFYTFLKSNDADVRASCEEARDQAVRDTAPERRELAADIAMRPYERWVACEASKALICGRNRETIKLCERLFELDPADQADARFTCALAYAKLEDEQGLDALDRHIVRQVPRGSIPDAWMLISRAALAHKSGNDDQGAAFLRQLAAAYPYAAEALADQKELPDGVYARLCVAPLSEDELIVALSEATVLLQEGRDNAGRGSFGSWVYVQARELSHAGTPDPRERS